MSEREDYDSRDVSIAPNISELLMHVKWLHYCLREAGYCIDGGKCHHGCDVKGDCWRQDGCSPLSGSRLTDDWKLPGKTEKDPWERGEVCPVCAGKPGEWTCPEPSKSDIEARFVAEHGHRLAQLLNIDPYDIADRDAKIMELLKSNDTRFTHSGNSGSNAFVDRRHVGDSCFEGWYQGYAAKKEQNPKQIARDAYAAGMGDPTPQPSAEDHECFYENGDGVCRECAELAAEKAEIMKAIDALIYAAWYSGEQDSVDDVKWHDQGDSYNQTLRSNIKEKKDKLLELLKEKK